MRLEAQRLRTVVLSEAVRGGRALFVTAGLRLRLLDRRLVLATSPLLLHVVVDLPLLLDRVVIVLMGKKGGLQERCGAGRARFLKAHARLTLPLQGALLIVLANLREEVHLLALKGNHVGLAVIGWPNWTSLLELAAVAIQV